MTSPEFRFRRAAIALIGFLLAASACSAPELLPTGPSLTIPQATEPLVAISPVGLASVAPSQSPGAGPNAGPLSPTPRVTPQPADDVPDGTVRIRNFAFEPREIAVDQGDSLVFRNEDFQAHTVVPLTDGDFSAPDTLPAQRESDPVVFAKSGEIRYRCGIHPNETGLVRVRDTGDPDSTPTPEPTDAPDLPDGSPTPTPTPVPTPVPTPTPMPVAGTVSTVIASSAFTYPEGLALDLEGNFYVADSGSNKIFKVRPDGVITLLAGSGTYGFANGTAQATSFRAPRDVAVDTHGYVYVADTGNHRIRRIDTNLPPSDPSYVITFAGGNTPGNTDGVGPGALFRDPTGLSVDVHGTVFVADSGNHLVRAIHSNSNVERIGGTGVAGFLDGNEANSRFHTPYDTGVDLTNRLYVTDRGNNAVRRYNNDFSLVSTPFGVNPPALTAATSVSSAAFAAPTSLAHGPNGAVYLLHADRHAIRRFVNSTLTVLAGHDTQPGYVDGPLTQARFSRPKGLVGDASGNVYVMDTENKAIRRISP